MASYNSDIKGLQNRGENNCFINVAIQTLWNLKDVRKKILSISHSHSKEIPCVTCEISVIFI